MVAVFVCCNQMQGYEPFASPETLHELHIFIIVLALFHVVFSCITMLLALIKVKIANCLP